MITKKQRPETLFEIRQVLIQAIRANSDLSKLPADAIEDLAKQAARRKFVRRQIIFEAGQPAQDAWILVSGKAELGYTALSGASSATCVAGPGDLFCCLPILDGEGYPVTAISEKKSEVLTIPLAVFKQMLWQHPEVFQSVLKRMSASLRAVECGHCHRVDRVSVRIARTLLDLSLKHQDVIPLTKWDIARLSGTTVETTIRVMAEMKKKKAIAGAKEAIKILDFDKLRDFLTESDQDSSGCASQTKKRK